MLPNIADPNAPDPSRRLLLEEVRPVLRTVLENAWVQVKALGALPLAEKGTLELYLRSAGRLSKELFDVILLKRTMDPMPGDLIRKARQKALALYPCSLPTPDVCQGIEIEGERPCAHAVGRRHYEQFKEGCLAGLSPAERELLDDLPAVFAVLKEI